MSNPRRIVPGTTYLVTRRTTRRYFLMNPDKRRMLLAFYWYATAVLAAEFGIEIHAVQMLSNHLHEVLTDTRGRAPKLPFAAKSPARERHQGAARVARGGLFARGRERRRALW
jgi:REP element-mobilizing transposase RayT